MAADEGKSGARVVILINRPIHYRSTGRLLFTLAGNCNDRR